MPDTPMEEAPPGLESLEKVKKRYRKKKTKLEEAFPSYLQVCFWLHALLSDCVFAACFAAVLTVFREMACCLRLPV